MDLKEQIKKLVTNELHAFMRRGGDELYARWRDDRHMSYLELFNPHSGRKHEVFLAEKEGKCDIKISDYGVSEVLGIRCASREAVILDTSHDFFNLDADGPSPDALRTFARRFARVLDENSGRFEPTRQYGIAVTRNARLALQAVSLSLPEDGSIQLVCNNDPYRGTVQDEIAFVGPDADPLDFHLWVNDDVVTAFDKDGAIARFDETQLMTELRELVRERVAAYQNTPTP